jgi:methionyl-tRNA formyltransferase
VAAYVSRSLFNLRFFRKRAWSLVKDGFPFCIRAGDLGRYVGMKWGGRARRRQAVTMIEYLRKRGLTPEYIDDVRSESALANLRALDADVFIFCPFDKIVGPAFLSIPRLGTFNAHMGKLPEHKGGLSAFWVLRFGDAEAGMTVHRAVEELDAGEIVAETRFPVTTRSMYELMHETFDVGGHTVARALGKLVQGGWTPVDTEGRASGYYRIPTRRDFREFYARGNRLI